MLFLIRAFAFKRTTYRTMFLSQIPDAFFSSLGVFAEKQALGEVSAELLDTQVNPAVWEISEHMVLKRKENYDSATEENAWRLLAEVSLSVERFQEVIAIIFEAISCTVTETTSLPEEDDQDLVDVDALNNSESHQTVIVAVKQECIVQH